MNKELLKFSELLSEQFAKSIDKNSKAEFEDIDLNTPYIKKIIEREAELRGKSIKEVTTTLQARVDAGMDNFKNANQRQNSVNMKNMIESILFDYITTSEKVPKVTLKELKEMIKYVRVSNPAFFKLKDPITGKKVKVSIHITPAPKFVKQPAWMKGVSTAAATANGELIFNVEFCKQLIQYAHAKGVKPAGGMYKSNGGNIPDAYAYIEFLILHEIYHIVHADHFYGAVDLFNLMMKEGPVRWPKLLQSAGWSGDISSKKGRKTLRRAARRANGKIQNYVGDYITNYELVKKGYAQLPIGLFATDYNYDNFDSMEEIQIAVLDDMEEGTPDPKDSMLDKISKMQAEMDEHLDSNNEKVDADEGEEAEDGSPAPGGPDLSDMPDEEEIEQMSPEELADMLDKMNGDGEDLEMSEEEMQDMQDIQDAIQDRIEDIMEDDEVSDEEKEAIQDALDKQGSGSGEGSGSDEDYDEDEDYKEGGNGGEGESSDEESDNDEDGSGGSGESSDGGTPQEETTQEKIDKAMKETAEDDEALSADERDELTPEEVDKRIKELEEEAEAEEEERMKKVEEAKEERKKQRDAALAAEGERKPANPINWKMLLKKMVPKPIETEEESITKMHNRTKSSLAVAMDDDSSDGVAIKAGIIKDEKNIQKLLFVLDNSGSMSSTISGINPDIMKVIEKSKKNGIQDMYIIKFDSDWDVYKIDLDKTGKKHKFRQFKNNKDIVKKADLLNDEKRVEKLLEKNSYPIAQLFNDRWGGGTTFPVEMSKIILQLISGKNGNFNGVMFTDTDILGDGNMAVLKKIAMAAAKRPFSFNIILDSKFSFNSVKPKLSGYKYLSYIGDKELK